MNSVLQNFVDATNSHEPIRLMLGDVELSRGFIRGMNYGEDGNIKVNISFDGSAMRREPVFMLGGFTRSIMMSKPTMKDVVFEFDMEYLNNRFKPKPTLWETVKLPQDNYYR